MDLRYWGEAFMYAVHIRSLTLTSGLKRIVPYEAWTGRKADVSHLWIGLGTHSEASEKREAGVESSESSPVGLVE